MSRAFIRLLPLLSAIFIGVRGASAQAPVEVLLTHDRLQLFLPEDIRIQDGVRGDSTILVAWGSTAAVSATVARRVLYAQALRNGSPVGLPLPVHSDSAVPVRFVFVRAHGSGFRVIWNDARPGAAGIYVREVGSDGVPVGDETRVAEGEIRSVDGPAELPGLSFLYRNGRPPLLLDESGELRELPGLPGPESSVRDFTADSAVAFMRGDSLLLFNSFLDSLPSHRLYADYGDSVVPGTSTLLHIDGGAYQVAYITRGAPSVPSLYETVLQFRLMAGTLDVGSGMLRDVVVADSVFVGVGAGSLGSSIVIDGIDRLRPCNGLYHLRIRYHTAAKLPGQPEFINHFSWSCRVSAGDSRSIPSAWFGTEACPSPSSITVERIADGGRGTVDVHLDDPAGTVRLSVPAAFTEEPVSHRVPGLAVRDGALLVTWSDSKNSRAVVLRAWRPAAGEPGRLQPLESLTLPADTDYSSGAYERNGLQYGTFDYGGYGVRSSRSRMWSYQYGWVIRWSGEYLFPFPDGWRRFLLEEGGGPENGSIGLRSFAGLAFDPDSRSQLVASRIGPPEVYLHEIDSSGTTFWSGRLAGGTDRRIYFGAGRFAEIDDSGSVKNFLHDLLLDSVRLDDWNPSAAFTRLYGGRTLRRQLRSDGMALQLVLYDDRWRPIARTEIPFGDSLTGLAAAQSGADSSIALVLATNAGVYLTGFDRSLDPITAADGLPLVHRPVGTATARAANPSAQFRNDTLFIVWEDYRSGLPDIYAALLRPDRYTSGIADEGKEEKKERKESDRLDIFPNPATDRITLRTVIAQSGPVAVLVVDAAGRRVLQTPAEHAEAGVLRRVLDISSLAPGFYRIVLRMEGDTVAEDFIIPDRMR